MELAPGHKHGSLDSTVCVPSLINTPEKSQSRLWGLGKETSRGSLASTKPSLLEEEGLGEAEGVLIFCQGQRAERIPVKNDPIN